MNTLDATTTTEMTVASPDGALFIPTYVPTIEETVKASGAHRTVMN
ncbi:MULTISPECIES: hypothetical protein [unclassified Frondihabitans]|nr:MULTISPECIES: hypothetical protein [unclassified Frondihabitans]RPE77415.1 hypothetical protein EDF37_0059 [Frondihabitans sp. PhB153]RPF07691.1 hypothetical protein EDF39_0059 [Frondihabitans sp. PhB161]